MTLGCLVHANVATSFGTVSATLVKVLLGHPVYNCDARHIEQTLPSEAGSCSFVLLKHILLTASSSGTPTTCQTVLVARPGPARPGPNPARPNPARPGPAPRGCSCLFRTLFNFGSIWGHSSLHNPAALTPRQ